MSAAADAAVVPRQLPRGSRDFLGRDSELHAILADIDLSVSEGAVPVISISGPPGVGKSLLAIHATHLASTSFPGGQLYYDFRSKVTAYESPMAVMAMFLRALGVSRESIPRGRVERLALYRSLIAASQVQLLLDNAVTVEQVEDLLPAYPTSMATVTGRPRLDRLDATLSVELKALPSADAANLLKRLIDPVRQEALSVSEAEAIAQICGGVPTAIRVVASYLRSNHATSVEVVTSDLKDYKKRHALLRRSVPEITASLQLSYDTLDASARQVLHNVTELGLSQIPVWLVAGAMGADLADVTQSLNALCDANFAERRRYQAEGHLLLSDIVAAFVGDLVVEHPVTDPRHTVQEAVRTLFQLASQSRTSLQPWNAGDTMPAGDARSTASNIDARMQEAEASFIPVLEKAAEHQLWSDATSLADALMSFFEIHAAWEHWEIAARIGYDAAMAATDYSRAAEFSRQIGRVHRESGDWRTAEAAFSESVRLFKVAGDHSGEANALRGLGTILRYRGKFREAKDVLAISNEMSTEARDRHGSASSLRSLALLARDEGETAHAIALAEQALALFREIVDVKGQAATLRNLGILYREEGRISDSLSSAEASLRLCADLGDPRGTASGLRNRGDTHLRVGRLEDAERDYLDSLHAFAELGDKHWQAATLVSLGTLHVAKRNVLGAVEFYEQALANYKTLGDLPRAIETLRALERCAEVLGATDDRMSYRSAVGELERLLAAG